MSTIKNLDSNKKLIDSHVSYASIRSGFRTMANTVSILSTVFADRLYAKTISSFVSLSLEPPTISLNIATGSPIKKAIQNSGHFGINVLNDKQIEIANYFSSVGSCVVEDETQGMKFFEIDYKSTKKVKLNQCLTFFHCQLVNYLTYQDHLIVLGRVLEVEEGSGIPLIYYNTKYRTLKYLDELKKVSNDDK